MHAPLSRDRAVSGPASAELARGRRCDMLNKQLQQALLHRRSLRPLGKTLLTQDKFATVNHPSPFTGHLVGEASVCYSGGLDSTWVAHQVTAQGRRAHLHTLNHGYGYIFNQWSRRTSSSLARSAGRHLVNHVFLDTKDLFKVLSMDSLAGDIRKYGQTFGCCLGCTMAMVTKIIIFNLENQVPYIMMGSSVGGQYAVMSMQVVIELQRELCARYGLIYSAPLIEGAVHKERERRDLSDAGVSTGWRFLDKHSFGNQGYCMLSLQHLPDVLFNTHPTYEPDAVKRFFLDKAPACEAYIEQHFERTGRSLDEHIARLGAVTKVGPGVGEERT